MSKISLERSVRGFAEQAAYHTIFRNRFIRSIYELLGRWYQQYPGQFLELKEIELNRYPSYRNIKCQLH